MSEYRRWSDWGPSVTAVEAPGSRVETGCRGRVKTAAGPWVPFEITRVEGWSWDWRVLGIDATGHRVEQTPRGSRVVFSAPRWAFAYAPVLWLALRRIARLAEALEAEVGQSE